MSTTAFPRWALAVDLVVSALSVIGGLAIVVGYLHAPQKQHLRLKLILGLGVTGAYLIFRTSGRPAWTRFTHFSTFVTDFVQATTTLYAQRRPCTYAAKH